MSQNLPQRGSGVTAATLVCVAAAALSACAVRGPQPSVRPVVTRVSTSVPTLEASDERLAQALRELAAAPAHETFRRVADEYRRLGIFDLAHEHYTEAVKRDPRDAASHDALARIWRQWGMPQMGLADAYRAARLAPASAAAANTVGTLLQATGQLRLARLWYAKAIALDPSAAYALSNFCYAVILLEQPDAVATCHRAVDAAPRSAVARNNLALAYAAAGDMEKAREQFQHVGYAAADYNMGILHMARRDYRSAAREFGAALYASPQSTQIARRAQDARLAADAAEGTR